MKVGLGGCGGISGADLTHARAYRFLRGTACCDLGVERAKAKGAEFGVARVLALEAVVADAHVAVVLNLTVPRVHGEISLRSLEAGKHVYSEKPLATSVEEGRRLIEVAERKNVRLGCAPDTFMGAGIQTARKLIEEGAI